MPHVRGTVHGIGAMVTLVVGSILTDAISETMEAFALLSSTTTHLLVGVAGLPLSEEVAGIVVPVGVLMSVWVVAYEVQRLARA